MLLIVDNIMPHAVSPTLPSRPSPLSPLPLLSPTLFQYYSYVYSYWMAQGRERW